MNERILSSSATIFQVVSTFNSTDGAKIMEKVFDSFIENLILENAVLKADHFSLFVSNLDHAEKKMFLSHLVSAEDYQDFTENVQRELEAFKEYESEMQAAIDDRIDQVYFNWIESRRESYDEILEDHLQCMTTSLT